MGSSPPLPDPTIGGDPEPKPKPIQVNKTDGRVGLPVSARVPGTLLPLNGRPRREAPFGRIGGVADDAAADRRKSPPEVQKGRERRRERTCQILCDLGEKSEGDRNLGRMDLEDNPNQVPGGPEYTELGIKVMGYKFTMKLQRRASSASAERARMAAAAAASETATEVRVRSILICQFLFYIFVLIQCCQSMKLSFSSASCVLESNVNILK